jgi:hypothetical protein
VDSVHQFLLQDLRERTVGKAMSVSAPEEAKAAARKELDEVSLPAKVRAHPLDIVPS